MPFGAAAGSGGGIVEGCTIGGAGAATSGADAPCKGIRFAVAENTPPVALPKTCCRFDRFFM